MNKNNTDNPKFFLNQMAYTLDNCKNKLPAQLDVLSKNLSKLFNKPISQISSNDILKTYSMPITDNDSLDLQKAVCTTLSTFIRPLFLFRRHSESYDSIKETLHTYYEDFNNTIISIFKSYSLKHPNFVEGAIILSVDPELPVPIDFEMIKDFISYGFIKKGFLLVSPNSDIPEILKLSKKDINSLLNLKEKDTNNYLFTPVEVLQIRNTYGFTTQFSSSDIIENGLSVGDFDLGLEGYLFEKDAFLHAFIKKPVASDISSMFFLMNPPGHISPKHLPDIYKASKSVDPELASKKCLQFFNLFNYYQLKLNRKLTPEMIEVYNSLFENTNERISHEEKQLQELSSIAGNYTALFLGFSLLEDGLFLPDSFKNLINTEILKEIEPSATCIAKLYSANLIDLPTLKKSLSLEEIVEQHSKGNLNLNPETNKLDLNSSNSDTVYQAYNNGLVSPTDISSYMEEHTETPPKTYLGKLYSDGLIPISSLQKQLSENELLEMHSTGTIGPEIVGVLSETTTDEGLNSQKLSLQTIFSAYENSFIDVERFVSHQPTNFDISIFVTPETPSEKVEELFFNDVLSYTQLKKLESNGTISADTKKECVSKYDISPRITRISKCAAIKYNTYKPENSIDPEELLITLGAENIIPASDTYNFSYIPEHNTGILYQTINNSGFIGTSNKTYVMELLDAIEVVETGNYSQLPKKYSYITATANFGTELLQSIHSIDNSFEYEENPDLANAIEDIKIQVLGDREV